MSNVQLNYAQVIDPISFKSVPSGKIYIGEYGTLPNPENSGTWKQAYFVNSDGTRASASQPIRTNAAGFAVDGSGNIKAVQVDGQYSLLVHDQFNSTKFSTAKVDDIWSDLSSSSPDHGAALVSWLGSPLNIWLGSKVLATESRFAGGADASGIADSSAAIIDALSQYSYVTIPAGTYRCDTMIEVGSGKTLELMPGATLVRKASGSASTDPVVWIKGSNASLIGSSMTSGVIKSENRCPNGVVNLGHFSMTASHANVTYCSLGNLTISGPVTYGQTTGNPDVALMMQNPEFGGLASYFHNIYNLKLESANIGAWLRGYANANTFSNIQGYRLGNVTLGADLNCFVRCDGALDNSWSNSFFHSSPDSIGLYVNVLDNTANGGSVHTPFANSFRGFVCEQGGASAVGLKALAGTRCFYELRDNVAGGNALFATFNDTNHIFGLSKTFITPNATITALASTTLSATSDAQVLGALRLGDAGSVYSASKTKRTASTNASTLSFTLSNTVQASVYRHGLLKIAVSGGDVGSDAPVTAWFVYAVSCLNQAFPNLKALKDSGGDVASFTISMTGGVLTIATTQDTLVATVEYAFTTTNVNIT